MPMRRAAALRDVARRLDCATFLALTDVHETWSGEENDPDYGRAWVDRREIRKLRRDVG